MRLTKEQIVAVAISSVFETEDGFYWHRAAGVKEGPFTDLDEAYMAAYNYTEYMNENLSHREPSQ